MSAKAKKREQTKVCTACGKRENDRGWDVSCHMHGVWVWTDTIEEVNGRVTNATAVPVGEINA